MALRDLPLGVTGFFVISFFSSTIVLELFSEGLSFSLESNNLDGLELERLLLVGLFIYFIDSGFGMLYGKRMRYKFYNPIITTVTLSWVRL